MSEPKASHARVRLLRLKEWREKRLLTQADLAERSGVAETTINRIERGHHEPRFSTVRKLATALDVAAATLMDSGEEEAKLAA